MTNQIESPFSLGAARGKGQDVIKGQMMIDLYPSTPADPVNKNLQKQLKDIDAVRKRKAELDPARRFPFLLRARR